MLEPKKKIVIVEDDPEIRMIMMDFLQSYSEYEVQQATNASEAMQILKGLEKGECQALLLDLMMPYGDQNPEELDSATDPEGKDTGIRLLRWLREIRGDHTMWVAVVTAKNTPEVVATIQPLLGQRGRFYTKPFNDFHLAHDLATALGVNSRVPAALQPR